MLEWITELLTNYGYWIVLAAALIEGEHLLIGLSAVVSAGFGDLDQKLSLTLIILVAFIGTTISDQVLYYFGKYFGPRLLKWRPSLQPKADKAFDLLKKRDIWFIMANRFMYGLRIIGPIMIGSSGVDPRKFFFWNVIAAFVWAVVVCVVGYLLGSAAEEVLGNFDKYKFYVFGFIAAIVLGIVLYKLHKRRRA